MRFRKTARLIAVVGGSAAGKTWLVERLQEALDHRATHLSLDDFYRDRSHLSPARQRQINFDHPRVIDWPAVEQVLRDCQAGRTTKVPRYDFASHMRLCGHSVFQPEPVVIVEGLWLLHHTPLRRLFALKIFVECPGWLRLQRRLVRDVAERGRSRASIHRPFRHMVAPMHARYVAPQKRWADVVVQRPLGASTLHRLVDRVNALLPTPPSPENRYDGHGTTNHTGARQRLGLRRCCTASVWTPGCDAKAAQQRRSPKPVGASSGSWMGRPPRRASATRWSPCPRRL